MASNSETGHAVNISNFKLMIDRCTALGAPYNPSATKLLLTTMNTQWTTCNTAHASMMTALANSKAPINERDLLYAPLNKLVTKTFKYFKSTDADTEIRKDAKGLAEKVKGSKIKVVKLPDGTPDPSHVSTSHLSFVKRAESFKELIDIYHNDVNYAPNETELTYASLISLWASMKSANDNIGTIIAPVDALRTTRNHNLYDTTVGMVDVSKACKDYVESVFGVNSQEAKPIRKIAFRAPTKK